MTHYRLLFLDIDGTLVGASGILASRTLDRLHQAQRQGAVLVLCTGRGRHSTARVAAQIGGHGYVIVLNGALVFEWESGRILREVLLPLSLAQTAIEIAHQMQVAPIWLGTEATDDRIYTDRRSPLVPGYQERNAARLVYSDDLALHMPAAPASLVSYGSESEMGRLVEAWRRTLGPPIRAFCSPSVGYGCWVAQLTGKEADKALAAELVAQQLGIPREETLAIGDHANDANLIQWAGLGVCMGGGDPSVQAVADHVTGTLEQDGVALALEQFVLTPPL